MHRGAIEDTSCLLSRCKTGSVAGTVKVQIKLGVLHGEIYLWWGSCVRRVHNVEFMEVQ